MFSSATKNILSVGRVGDWLQLSFPRLSPQLTRIVAIEQKPALPPSPSLTVLPSGVFDDFAGCFDRSGSVGMDAVIECDGRKIYCHRVVR